MTSDHPSTGRLRGRVVLAFGASPNINAGIILALAAEGADVACVDRSEAHAHACAEEVQKMGVRALPVVADVAKEDQAVAAVDRAVEELGGVDVLVNGVAFATWHTLLESSVAEFRSHFDVIVGGPFVATQRCATTMIEQGRPGSIINLLSTEAHQGRPGNIGYGVAKAALGHFTRCAAMELAEHGIRVNSLTPTATDPNEGKERTLQWGLDWAPQSPPSRPHFTSGDQGVPLGHRPTPSDYGRAAVFLASDDSRMVTGMDLRVDGGVIARYWRFNPGVEIPTSTPVSPGSPEDRQR